MPTSSSSGSGTSRVAFSVGCGLVLITVVLTQPPSSPSSASARKGLKVFVATTITPSLGLLRAARLRRALGRRLRRGRRCGLSRRAAADARLVVAILLPQLLAKDRIGLVHRGLTNLARDDVVVLTVRDVFRNDLRVRRRHRCTRPRRSTAARPLRAGARSLLAAALPAAAGHPGAGPARIARGPAGGLVVGFPVVHVGDRAPAGGSGAALLLADGDVVLGEAHVQLALEGGDALLGRLRVAGQVEWSVGPGTAL